MLRKTIFWAHLVSGVAVGLVVFTMSISGVLLTYERQILAWEAESQYIPVEAQTNRQSLEELLFETMVQEPNFSPSSITINSNPGAPVNLQAGRSNPKRVNPYTGQQMAESSLGMERVFSSITGFHRWFGISGERRGIARAITGASNLVFLFLVLSGMYLWLPRIWKWRAFKAHLLFNNKVNNSKSRDYNWHHVFGIWSAFPLAVVVSTALVFSYGWANQLVAKTFSSDVVPEEQALPFSAETLPNNGEQYLNLDQLFLSANNFADENIGDWRQIRITLPSESSSIAQISVDSGNGGQPQLQSGLDIDRRTGVITSWQKFSNRAPNQQARIIIRFLHTGEVLGIWGQTIAGLVSLFSLIMVWTGFALSYRRLIQPLFAKKS